MTFLQKLNVWLAALLESSWIFVDLWEWLKQKQKQKMLKIASDCPSDDLGSKTNDIQGFLLPEVSLN